MDAEKKRFWAKVDIGGNEECWCWLGCTDRNGYGRSRFRGSTSEGAHRIAWILTYGEIPDGLCVCHTCDNPGCVNPKHLFVGTHADNMADMVRKGRAGRGGYYHGGSNNSKLSKVEVLEIRRLRRETSLTLREIGEMFGVLATTIYNVVSGKSWKDIL